MATTKKIPAGYVVENYVARYKSGHQKISTLVRYPDGKVVRFTERLSKGEAVRQAMDLRRREEARGGHHAVTERDKSDKRRSRDPLKRVPRSTYYRSGSSFERYKKPSAKTLNALKVSRVVHERGRNWRIEFADGMGVHVHEAETPGRFYTRAVHDRVRFYEEAREVVSGSPTALAYQYVALAKVVPHQSAFHVQPRYPSGGDLTADVHEEHYPHGRDPHTVRRRSRR